MGAVRQRMAGNRGLVVATILIVFSTTLSLLVVDSKNGLLVALMAGLLPLLIIDLPHVFQLPRVALLFGFLTYVIAISVLNFDTIRGSSVFYTLLFLYSFIYYVIALDKAQPRPEFLGKIFKYLIWAYFVMLIMQQSAAIVGLPIPNKISSIEADFRFNSLALEPSHAARILAFLLYAFVTAKSATKSAAITLNQLLKEEWRTVLVFLYTMITIGSASAMLFIGLLSVQFMRVRDAFWMVVFALMALAAANSVEYVPLQRSLAFLEALVTLDQAKMIAADHSGSLRVIGQMIYLQRFDFSDLTYWIGGGAGYEVLYFRGWLPGVTDESTGTGSVNSILLNYGLIGGFLFTLVFANFCLRRNDWYSVVLWLALISSSPLNTQVFWLSLILLATNVYLSRRIYGATRASIQAPQPRPRALKSLSSNTPLSST